jgi:hypothetical protein
MKKQLFFDDGFLFGRENVERKYGKAELIKDACYQDGVCSTDWPTGNVFKTAENEYRMVYMGMTNDSKQMKLFMAKSTDGIHFTPDNFDEDFKAHGKVAAHEIMDIPNGFEVADVYEDPTANAQEKYKLLMSEYNGAEIYVHDYIYTSADLFRWTKTPYKWAEGTEPIASAFYNEKMECHTFIARPFWGVRTIGAYQTKDFKTLSPFRYCLCVDSLDEPLMELYGMTAFFYEGTYIGFAHTYREQQSSFGAKYKGGVLDVQLAYSYDGEYWQRSLRTPFLSGVCDLEKGETEHKLLWARQPKILDDGDVYIYASASELEHGPAFDGSGTGKILVYKLRRDGFVYLQTKEKEKPAVVISREKLWNGGELHLNLQAKRATVAVYTSSDPKKQGNPLGFARPIKGYTHEDCIAFEGDSKDWIPVFKSGKKLADLKGETLVIEVKFEDGKLYSLSGDYQDVFNTVGERYRLLGIEPKNNGDWQN